MKNVLRKSAFWYFSKSALSYWLVLLFDCFTVILAGLLAQGLISGPVATFSAFAGVVGTWCVYLLFYIIGFRVMHTYSGVLRFSSMVDLMRIAVANSIGIALIFLVRHFTPVDNWLMPIRWQELAAGWGIATSLMWASRIAVKYLYDIYYVSATSKNVFIYGVKEGGIAIAKSLHNVDHSMVLAGFVTDDQSDVDHLLMGVNVYMNDDKLIDIMKAKKVRTLIVSPFKTEALRANQSFVDKLVEADIKMMMYSQQVWDGKSEIGQTQLKEVDIEDLLPRDQIAVDLEAIGNVLRGKCIMITGAAGSIGSEIVRQVANFKPAHLVLIDQAETPLHDIRLMMKREYPAIPALTLTASIVHEKHMEAVFKQYRPQYVFHAAAYKHVPMMEDNPGEAIINNVHGTRIIADLAVKYGAEKFVMVSTDKAVNPTNVMGCSKRICEMYCQSLDRAIKEGSVEGHTQFVTTRFGNVLGSNGSVIPLFKKQIHDGGPLTVTHPDIIRYFMLIPEACKLVLQAGTMGKGSEIYVFDMGKPVRIADLARRMIILSGATGVEIKYTGLRDGEKLYEELLNQEESTKPSSHPKIKLANVRELAYADVLAQINHLCDITRATYDDMQIVREMKRLVPEFKSMHSKYEVLDKAEQ